MTLLVRNEADMIEANLDYHLAQGVDFVLVTDHGSSDDTRERLRPYERDGMAAVIEETGDGHHQSRRVTRMAQLAIAGHGADWLIHNDADEFWWPLSGCLRDVFAAIPDEYAQIVVPRRNFLPVREGAGRFYSRQIYREAESRNLVGRALEPKVAHRAHPDVVLAPGNHELSGAGLRPVPVSDLIEIFHFPMRNFAQFERKVIQVGTGYEQLEHRSPEVGRDQLYLLELQRADKLRRYWEDAVPDDAALARGLADGSIVLDRRLDSFMRSLADGSRGSAVPDARATRSLVASALRAIVERDALRDAFDEAQAAVAALRSELAAAAADLQAVRRSRLLRWSAPLRRLWYRAR